MEKTKILVVDDHMVMRDGLRALLGIHDDIEIVGEAADGKTAIEKVNELAPDIVIMDIVMPNMDGLEATRYIRDNIPDMKVIMLTQYDDEKYIKLCHQIGAAGFIPKRAAAKELVSIIRAIQEGHSFIYSILQVQN